MVWINPVYFGAVCYNEKPDDEALLISLGLYTEELKFASGDLSGVRRSVGMSGHQQLKEIW